MQKDHPDGALQILKSIMDKAGIEYNEWMEYPLFKMAKPGHLYPK